MWNVILLKDAREYELRSSLLPCPFDLSLLNSHLTPFKALFPFGKKNPPLPRARNDITSFMAAEEGISRYDGMLVEIFSGNGCLLLSNTCLITYPIVEVASEIEEQINLNLFGRLHSREIDMNFTISRRRREQEYLLTTDSEPATPGGQSTVIRCCSSSDSIFFLVLM